ncbi:MAG: right-handed parallel beta-helix repeat-containing protein, partial [Candidatus Thermoplasmatota archaeon]
MHHTNITKLLAIFLLTSLLFSIFPLSQTARASEPPPWGDWVVENNTTVTNETIIVHGDVIVKSGGTLTLINCVLKIDSPIPGLNGIEVEKGGGLCVYDTIITSNGASQYYYFEVYGMVMIDGADISKMYLDGLVICDTKDVAIKNSSVHDGGPIAYGICFANSTGTILNNNIYNNFRGIVIVGESKVSISNNIITSNYDDGISCIDDSEVSINSNTISNTYGERGRGISIQGNSKVNISNNIITSNYQLGIFCGHDSEANINNNTISDTYSERGRGIDIEDNSKVNISNNIITSNRQAGIFCARNSEVNINNNTISETYGKRGRGIGIEDNSKVSISNNIITSNCRGGILCSHDAEVIINNNTISYTYDENGAGVGTTDNSKAGISN